MNKKGLVDVISAKTGKTKKEIEELLDITLETIEEVVASGQELKIIGHGVWRLRKVPGRKGECKTPNVKGKMYQTEDSYKPFFDAGKYFLEKCNGGI